MFHIAVYDIIQNHITEIWGVKDCNLYVLLWANAEEKCSTTPLFFYIFIEISVCHDCVLYE